MNGGEIGNLVERVFGGDWKQYEASKPSRLWIRTAHGWMSVDPEIGYIKPGTAKLAKSTAALENQA